MKDSMYAYRARTPSKSTDPEIPIVFIVDGDASTREALDTLIRCAGWRREAAAAAEDFLALPRTAAPSCLLTELTLPGLSGLELQQVVLDRPEMPVIFLSRHADVRATVQAMKAGAFDVLTKPFLADVLLQAIRHAIEHSRAALLRLAKSQELKERYESLSRREREVMSLVVSGRLNKQVGGDLGISEITVKAHRGKMMRKMQAGSLAELVNMAMSLCPSPPVTPHIGMLIGTGHADRCRYSPPAQPRVSATRSRSNVVSIASAYRRHG